MGPPFGEEFRMNRLHHWLCSPGHRRRRIRCRADLGAAMLFAVALGGAWFGSSRQAFGAADLASCAANPANRALDFWLGEWTIGAAGGAPNATSSVTLELDKCLVVERWDGGRGHSGANFFAYSADDRSWHGLFADNEGRVHVFAEGTVAQGSAEFSGPSSGPHGESILNRVTIRRVGETQVEQEWQKSTDGGKTWITAFRGEYRRKRP
jgi:hypothetical protein